MNVEFEPEIIERIKVVLQSEWYNRQISTTGTVEEFIISEVKEALWRVENNMETKNKEKDAVGSW